MNPQAVLKKTLKRGTGLMVTWIVFAVITVVCIALSLIPHTATPEAITPQNEAQGVYGYLDLYLITDSFAEDTGGHGLDYFLAQTRDGTSYMIGDYTSTFQTKYKALLDWSYSDEDDSTHPGEMRVTGVLKPMDSALVEYGAEWMEMSESDFENAFGDYYLDVTAAAPTSGDGSVWPALALLSGILAICFAVGAFAQRKPSAQTARRLRAAGEMERVEQELSSPTNLAYNGDKVIFTDNYLVSKEGGAIVRYSDILWCYVTVQRTNLVPTGQFLTLKTANRETYNVAYDKPGKKETGVTRGTMEEIARRNPGVLLGHTTDNVRAYSNRLAALAGRGPVVAQGQPAAAPQAPNATADYNYLGNIGGTVPNTPPAPPTTYTDYTNNGDPTIK